MGQLLLSGTIILDVSHMGQLLLSRTLILDVSHMGQLLLPLTKMILPMTPHLADEMLIVIMDLVSRISGTPNPTQTLQTFAQAYSKPPLKGTRRHVLNPDTFCIGT
jgi:hypothetical protein